MALKSIESFEDSQASIAIIRDMVRMFVFHMEVKVSFGRCLSLAQMTLRFQRLDSRSDTDNLHFRFTTLMTRGSVVFSMDQPDAAGHLIWAFVQSIAEMTNVSFANMLDIVMLISFVLAWIDFAAIGAFVFKDNVFALGAVLEIVIWMLGQDMPLQLLFGTQFTWAKVTRWARVIALRLFGGLEVKVFLKHFSLIPDSDAGQRS